MKKNVLIILSSAACLLTSCGNTRLPQIKDEEGIEIAKNILTRQSDSKLFQLPNKFVITMNSNSNTENNTPESYTKTWSKGRIIYNFDLDNLYYKVYQKNESHSGKSERTYYCFYDNANGTLYSANNYNGYKIRTENKMTAEAAKLQLGLYRSNLLNNITGNYDLINFEKTIKEAKELHAKYIAEKDQYYNYFVGSSDAKSLQFAMEEKLKRTLGDDPEYSGYLHDESSIIFKNDMVTSRSMNSNEEIKTKDGKFYKKSSSNTDISTSYGSCPIEKPNIGEYILH